jgi:hypothetical protein
MCIVQSGRQQQQGRHVLAAQDETSFNTKRNWYLCLRQTVAIVLLLKRSPFHSGSKEERTFDWPFGRRGLGSLAATLATERHANLSPLLQVPRQNRF